MNISRYAVEIQTIPFALAVGWTLPDAFPVAAGAGLQWNAVLHFPSAFNAILGFPIGFSTDSNTGGLLATPTPFGGVVRNGTIAYVSTITPQVQSNPSVLISCSGILNKYSASPVIHAFTAAGTSFGSLIQDNVASPSFSALTSGTYSQLRVQFLGTNFLPLAMRDPNSTILLTIKENGST